jgi:hypothetical protein
MRGFHCDNTIHVSRILWKNSSPPFYPYSSSFSSSSFQAMFGGFHYSVFMCIYVAYFHPLTLQYPFLSPSTYWWYLPNNLLYTFMSYFYYQYHHYFRTRFHKWARTYIFGLRGLAYVTQHEDHQFHPFSFKWHNFIFFMAE